MIQMILDEVKNWESEARPNNLAVLTPLGTTVSAGERKNSALMEKSLQMFHESKKLHGSINKSAPI